MNRKKEIIDAINAMSGKYSAYEVFTDWIRCMALSISNSLMLIHDKVWNDLYPMCSNYYPHHGRLRK